MWKGRMNLFLESIDHKILGIIKDGPYLPVTLVSTNLKPPGTTVKPTVIAVAEGEPPLTEDEVEDELMAIPKEERNWTDDDKRLVSLDIKARSLIAQALPNDVFHSVINCTTAKDMWKTLCIQYEGTDEIKELKKATLNRKYELFFSIKGEKLTETFNRFNCLLNDLKVVGIEKENIAQVNKFMDSLPDSWENIITCIKTSMNLKKLKLTTLYGTLLNHEQSKAQKKIAMKEYQASSSTAFVSNHIESACDSESESDAERNVYSGPEESSEDDVADMKSVMDDVALMASKFKRMNFRKPASSSASSVRSSRSHTSRFTHKRDSDKKKPMDKSEADCYNCGKKGHFAAECRSKKVESSKPKPSKADKYKAKYKRLKAQGKGKACVAEAYDWADSATSSEDEEVANLAYMAIAEDTYSEYQIESAGGWSSEIAQKVRSFKSQSNEDKILTFKAIINQSSLNFQIHHYLVKLKKDLVEELTACKNELKDLKDVKIDLLAQQQANTHLLEEMSKKQTDFENLKKITESWCQSTSLVTQCINEQIPNQVKAVLGGDYKTAAEIPKNIKFEADFSKPDFTSKTKVNKFVRPGKPVIIEMNEVSEEVSEPVCVVTKVTDVPSASATSQIQEKPSKIKTASKNKNKQKAVLKKNASVEGEMIVQKSSPHAKKAVTKNESSELLTIKNEMKALSKQMQRLISFKQSNLQKPKTASRPSKLTNKGKGKAVKDLVGNWVIDSVGTVKHQQSKDYVKVVNLEALRPANCTPQGPTLKWVPKRN